MLAMSGTIEQFPKCPSCDDQCQLCLACREALAQVHRKAPCRVSTTCGLLTCCLPCAALAAPIRGMRTEQWAGDGLLRHEAGMPLDLDGLPLYRNRAIAQLTGGTAAERQHVFANSDRVGISKSMMDMLKGAADDDAAAGEGTVHSPGMEIEHQTDAAFNDTLARLAILRREVADQQAAARSAALSARGALHGAVQCAPCAECGTSGASNKCARCNIVWYCGKECAPHRAPHRNAIQLAIESPGIEWGRGGGIFGRCQHRADAQALAGARRRRGSNTRGGARRIVPERGWM